MSNKKRSSNTDNKRTHDGFKNRSEVAEVHYKTQDDSNIDHLIYTPKAIIIQSSLRPYNGTPYGNDDAIGTPESSTNAPQCVKVQPSKDRRLPDGILNLFPGLGEQDIIIILKKVQDETDKIWAKIDKTYEKFEMTRTVASQMRKDFNAEFRLYLSNKFPTPAKSIDDAFLILQQSSFGVLICNMNNEVLGVQNHHGTWSAPKGHRKIKDNGELQTPWEAALRELFEEVSMKFIRKTSTIPLNVDFIGYFIALNKNKYLEFHFDSEPGTSFRSRLIGLFFVRVDENQFKFSLKDKKENQACEWLDTDDVLSNKPEPGRDKYYTLRPFVEYLTDHPDF